MKRITSLAFLFIIPVISFAQINFGSAIAPSLGGAVTATAENWEAIEINPANLGYSSNHSFSLSIMNVGVNLQDNGLTVNEGKQIYNGIKQNGTDSITPLQRQQAYTALTTQGGLNLNTTINWLSFSFTLPKIGGFAFSLTDEVYAHVQLSTEAATILDDLSGVKDSAELAVKLHKDSAILAQSPAQILKGTSMGAYHYRELNMDYGVTLLTINTHGAGTGGASFQNSEYINPNYKTSDTISYPIKIYGGFGFKPIWGEGSFSDVGNVEEATYVYADPNYLTNLEHLKNIFSANGRGYGIDLGLSATYKKWKFGASVIDIGQITWHNNTVQTISEDLPSIDSLQKSLKNNAQIFKYFLNQQTGPDFSTQLPTKFRTGLSYQLTKLITLNADYVAPLNTVAENLASPYISAGANINIFRAIGFGVGVAHESGYGTLIPVGFFLNILSGIEIYAGTNDIQAYLSNGNSHSISGSAGIKILGF